MNLPKVSCVMVTGHKPERMPLARVAIECFKKQTYPNLELLVINEGTPFCLDEEVLVEPGTSLGELRNLGLKHATGDLVIQWDDDDWYSPERVAVQVTDWEKAQSRKPQHSHAILLRREIVCDLTTGKGRVCDAVKWRYGGFPGTILHPRNGETYPDKAKSEDEIFMHRYKCLSVDNDPRLYVRTWNGLNTWDQAHYQLILRNSRELTVEEQETVDEAMRQYLAAGYKQDYPSVLK
jgi:glycosyltransferase involved in cell wall biosynthesis